MLRPIRVGIHFFETNHRHGGRDGANFAYTEIGRLLRESPNIELVPHNILRLFADDNAAYAALANCDVVMATVGPHSYIYFYLRERLGLNFRIVRDVRTALWNGYLLQEFLVGPYLRSADTVFYSSVYSRELFGKIFPNVSRESQYICYPLLHWFPKRENLPRRRSISKVFRIGYVGRLTKDKNFPQALELIAELERLQPNRFHLCAVGEGTPPNGDPRSVKEILGGEHRGYSWIPPVDRDEIWDYYSQFDVLFFPSTSSLETFGRVLAEATYAGVPTLGSNHGPTPELLDPDALLPTNYFTRVRFTAHLAAQLGQVDIKTAVQRLLDDPQIPSSHGYANYVNDASRLVQMVCEGNDCAQITPRLPTPAQADFIQRVVLHDMPSDTHADWTDEQITRLRGRFVALHQWYTPAYAFALADLLARSRFRRKTIQFLRHSIFRHEDFTNIGGVDLQFSHLLGFYPSFEINEIPKPPS